MKKMQILSSILDQDLYKLSMQWAVIQKFPRAWAQYELINRSDEPFPEEMKYELRRQVQKMASIGLTAKEANFLETACPFLPPAYIDFLSGYRFNPGEVEIRFTDGDLRVKVQGEWHRTILWEVPLMALISELYYRNTKIPTEGLLDVEDQAKAQELDSTKAPWADFGTRRRFSYQNHERVIEIFKKDSRNFIGTSNVYFAQRFRLKPIGTMAHEWISFHGSVYGYKMANELAMRHWVEVYQGDLGIALSDTYGADNFFEVFSTKYAKLFDGVRHDSGDPILFMHKVIDHYQELGIDPNSKTIIFSDGLDPKKVALIAGYCDSNIKCSFGIGTNLTNDLPDITPRNMVIKMTGCSLDRPKHVQPAIKLSDEPGKYTGDPKEIELCKQTLGLGD